MPSIRHNRYSLTAPRLRSVLALCLLWALSGPGQTIELPAWEQLVFEQKSFWATARGVITLSEFTDARGARDFDPAGDGGSDAGPQYLSLEVNNYVASSSEQITLTLNARTGAAQFRWRLSRGRETRVKIHEYADTGIARERREPPTTEATVSPADWPATRRMDVALPPAAKGRHIVATHALLALLPTLLADPARADDYLVHSDLNFFRLQASLSDKTETVSNTLTLNGEVSESARRCRVLTLRTLPLPGNPEEPDIMLMGMSGKIHVFIDIATGLPLRLRGDAPRLGRAELNLIEASTRDPRDPLQRLRPPPAP